MEHIPAHEYSGLSGGIAAQKNDYLGSGEYVCFISLLAHSL